MTRKSAQAENHNARLIQFTIDHSTEPAFWIGSDARFIYVNQAACRSLGYSRQALLALSVHDINPDLTRERWADHWALIKQNGRQTFEARHQTRDGRILPVEVSVSYLRFEGQEYQWALVHDLTERRIREEERNRLEAQMQDVQKLESLGVLAGGIAHDFNNFLMAILGNADLALFALPSSSSVRHYVEEISQASKRAAELCRQMLAYSGKGSMMMARHDLATIVGEMTEMLEAIVSNKITLRFHFDADLPRAMVDAHQVQQIVINLITNAAESLGGDKGDITIALGVMHCDRGFLDQCHLNHHLPEGKYLFLEVVDTGPGMDETTREKIFDPFFSTKFVGRGLGLAAVLGIVRSHGGAIHVNSAPGRGTAIKILLPPMEWPDSGTDASPKDPQVAGNTMLLIDDDPNVRQVSAEMLKLLGFKVMTAPHGPRGIELYAKYHESLACVILDCTLPESIGQETFDAIQGINRAPRVILSSGYTQKEVLQSFGGRPFSGFLQKPYTLEAMRDILLRALEN